MRLLVVDDELRIARFLVKGLSLHGYLVDHVGTGAEAIERASGGDGYHLVLLDLGLPDMDGLEVLRRLRAKGITVPVVILTARDGDRDRGLALGADDYFVKPTPFGRLLEGIRHSIALHTG